jgi:hypothetical protein
MMIKVNVVNNTIASTEYLYTHSIAEGLIIS